tara:strand:+ start:10 stop:195 length:186 start_codon:yes stop_codon:yes gene_type:complete
MPLIFMIQLPKHSFKRGWIIAHAHHFGNSREQPFSHVRRCDGTKPAMQGSDLLRQRHKFTT